MIVEVTHIYGWISKDGTVYTDDEYPVPLRKFFLDYENCAALLISVPDPEEKT